MRLDKYLKVSRLIKRRTVAKEVSDQGKISINGKIAKPSDTVKLGDELELFFGMKSIKVRITKIQDTTKKDEAKEMYEVLES